MIVVMPLARKEVIVIKQVTGTARNLTGKS